MGSGTTPARGISLAGQDLQSGRFKRLKRFGVIRCSDRFLVGCEDCASHIIPDLALIKNKVQRADSASAKRPANRLGNPLLVRKIC
jgi:hypothetical protein